MIAMNKIRDIEHEGQQLLDEVDFRPMSARSLLLSLLLGTHPPEMSVGRLVAFGEHFGLRAGTIRTALSRLVAAGDATVDDGRYRLAGRMLERQREQDEGQQQPPTDWQGDWWTAIVAVADRSVTERRHFRSAMVGGRMGELRPDLWMRPANVPGPRGHDGLLVTRGPVVSGDPVGLVARLWSTDAIESTSARLLAMLGRLDRSLDADRETLLPLSFDVSAACVRHLRTEPQLPRELVDMPASRALRTAYAEFNDRFLEALGSWISAG